METWLRKSLRNRAGAGQEGLEELFCWKGHGGTFNELCKELVPTASNELNVYSLLAW